MISIRDVSVRLPSNAPLPGTILCSVSLDIGRQDWLALVGPNGSGKTTLLHTIAGLVAPSAGTISVEPGVRTALLLQEPDNQFVTTSVSHELELSLPEGMTGPSGSERIGRAVDRFGLAPLLGRNPHRLSGGEKQRLALATVWLMAPDLLLLDEPTAYLDGGAASLCASFVEEARGGGAAVVWATPGGDELELADRVLCMEDGAAVYDGDVGGVYRWASETGFEFVRPRLRQLALDLSRAATGAAGGLVEAAAGGADGLAKAVAQRVAGGAGEQGRSSLRGDGVAPGPAWPAGRDVSVKLSGVRYGYGGPVAVAGVDLCVHEGECVGLAGPNGAGKSTVLALAAGALNPDAGRVERPFERGASVGRGGAFLLSQSPERMFFAETVAEELGFGLERVGVSGERRERRSRAALELVGLAPSSYMERAPLTLSPGEMRRVAFAIAISLAPRLLLLDEPTSCLDPAAQSVLASILSLRRSRGETTMVASHDAAFLAGVCDRIVWLCDGKVEAVRVTTGGLLSPGESWPGDSLVVLELQEGLARRGLDVIPRVLTAHRLAERLF